MLPFGLGFSVWVCLSGILLFVWFGGLFVWVCLVFGCLLWRFLFGLYFGLVLFVGGFCLFFGWLVWGFFGCWDLFGLFCLWRFVWFGAFCLLGLGYFVCLGLVFVVFAWGFFVWGLGGVLVLFAVWFGFCLVGFCSVVGSVGCF